MKVLTLTQPWASLVAVGAKVNETRSWRTNYRGPLAIQAANGFPRDARDFTYAKMVRDALAGIYPGDEPLDKKLPRGELIAVVRLKDVLQVEKVRAELTEQEEAFGNYDDGRFAWIMDSPRLIRRVPVKGSLGLWEWDEKGLEYL